MNTAYQLRGGPYDGETIELNSCPDFIHKPEMYSPRTLFETAKFDPNKEMKIYVYERVVLKPTNVVEYWYEGLKR